MVGKATLEEWGISKLRFSCRLAYPPIGICNLEMCPNNFAKTATKLPIFHHKIPCLSLRFDTHSPKNKIFKNIFEPLSNLVIVNRHEVVNQKQYHND